MWLTEERFNKAFSVFMVVGLAFAVVGASIYKFIDAESGKLFIVMSAFSSLMGALANVLSANGKVATFFFGLLDVSIYGILCLVGHKYGNGILHLLYFVPMQAYGLWAWKKRGASGDKAPKVQCLDAKGWAWSSAILLVGGAITYAILWRFDTSTDSLWKPSVFLDVVPFMCNILGQYFMSKAYREQWVFWILVNVFSIAMWLDTAVIAGSDSFATVYIVKYVFYLLNAINGLRIWIKLSYRS